MLQSIRSQRVGHNLVTEQQMHLVLSQNMENKSKHIYMKSTYQYL